MNRPADWSLHLAHPRHCADMASIAARVQGCAWLDAARIAALIGRRRSLFVTVDEQPAGFLLARAERRELHVSAMVVAEPFRCRGIGGGLMRAAMIDAGNGGFDAVTLLAPQAAEQDSDPARPENGTLSLAARLGFVPITDVDAHPRLAELVRDEPGAKQGAAPVAMIRFL